MSLGLALILIASALVPADFLPMPPGQNQPWTPPQTGLPKFLIAATATLAEQGLADPRGCEYREVEFVGEAAQVYVQLGKPRPVYHAWVLPAKAEGEPRFAVAWNGLVYPLAKIGNPAKLEDDVPPILGKDDLDGGRRFYSRATTHFQSATSTGHEPIRACLLLRLGRADLAERSFAAETTWKPPGSPRDLTTYGVSYMTLAADWTWAMFDRAVSAHANRDDPQALADARELTRVVPLIKAKARSMGFPDQPVDGSNASTFTFLKLLPTLLADQELRTKRPARPPVEAEKIADQAERIAALVAGLDEIAGGAWYGEMGGNRASSPLVGEGQAAVEPLLKVLESDDRLTRLTTRDDRRGTRTRTITPVFQVAYSTLVEILGTRDFSAGSANSWAYDPDPKKRRELAATIRAYAERYRGVTDDERWFRVLADDRGSPQQWIGAGAWIVARSGPPPKLVRRPRSFTYVTNSVRYDEKIPRKGDPLRSKKSPSVSDLFARRVETLAKPDAEFTSMHSAQVLALDLALWDPEAARPVLANLSRRCLDRVSGKIPERFGNQVVDDAATQAQITEARLQIGDPKAMADYAEMLETIDPRSIQSHTLDAIFGPLEAHPDDPTILAVAGRIFLEPGSRWLPFLGYGKQPNAWGDRGRLLGGPLLGLAPFRAMLVKTLGDRSAFGSSRLDDKGVLSYRVGNSSGGGNLTYIDPEGPQATDDVAMRTCDYLAWQLTMTLDGLPPLMPFWPEDRRDRIIADQVAFLERYGERFANSPIRDDLPDGPFRRRTRQPVFPPLDHPATAEDVRQGLAVFTLEGRGQTRVVPLANLPLAAKWLTLKDYAYRQESYNGETGKSTTAIVFDQYGLVWQAEEVLEGDKWRRYYGFVGRKLDRVPAEEVEFPDPFNRSGMVTDEVELQLTSDLEKPGIAILRLRNRAGLPRSVPTSFLDRNRPATRPGIDFDLLYSSTLGPGYPQGSRGVDPKWEVVPPKPIVRFTPDGSTKLLETGELFDAFTVRLADWFDASRPGTYCLRVRLAAESGIGQGSTNEIYLPIPAR